MFDIISSQLVKREGGIVRHRVRAVCAEEDEKQTEGLANGSECREMDTGKDFMLVEDEGEWTEQPASGGGSGSCFYGMTDWGSTKI